MTTTSSVCRHLLLVTICICNSCLRSSSETAGAGVQDAIWEESFHATPFPPKEKMTNGTWEVMLERNVVWQIPEKPRAVIFMAHGRNLAPLSYFDAGPGCPICYGLPEDRRLTSIALSQGYAVIAIKSLEPEWQNWPVQFSKDIRDVTLILSTWRGQHNLSHLPLALIGSSAGGNFSSSLALHLGNVKSLALIVSPGVLEVFHRADRVQFPPTFFAHMVRDEEMEVQVARSIYALNKLGVPVGQVSLPPLPITKYYFSERIVGIDLEIAEKIHEVYVEEEYVDADGYLTIYPPDTPWEKALAARNVLPMKSDGTFLWQSHVQQETMVAHGIHSITSIPAPEIFDWFEKTIFGGNDHKAGTGKAVA